jgi:hypothetical protein
MLSILKLALGWLTGGTLDRILSSVDNKIDNETTREAVKADLVADYMRAQVAILTGRGWWFPLFFVAPLGLWFASVCIYSMLFCARCAFPQSWSIAALPAPLDEWSGIIIGSLFVGKLGQELVARLRK